MMRGFGWFINDALSPGGRRLTSLPSNGFPFFWRRERIEMVGGRMHPRRACESCVRACLAGLAGELLR